MTNNDMKKYLKTEVKMAGLPADDIDTRVNLAIQMGVPAFWMAYSWRQKLRVTTLSVTAGDNFTNLPADFGMGYSIVEDESDFRSAPQFLQKSEFDERFPKTSKLNDGTPEYYTIYYDGKIKKHRISFAPRPGSSKSYPITYSAKAPTSVDGIWDEYLEPLTLFIVKFLYPAGADARSRIDFQIRDAVRNVATRDKNVDAPITAFHPKSTTFRKTREWVDGYLPY